MCAAYRLSTFEPVSDVQRTFKASSLVMTPLLLWQTPHSVFLPWSLRKLPYKHGLHVKGNGTTLPLLSAEDPRSCNNAKVALHKITPVGPDYLTQ